MEVGSWHHNLDRQEEEVADELESIYCCPQVVVPYLASKEFPQVGKLALVEEAYLARTLVAKKLETAGMQEHPQAVED